MLRAQAKWDQDDSGQVDEEEAYVAEMALLERQKNVRMIPPDTTPFFCKLYYFWGSSKRPRNETNPPLGRILGREGSTSFNQLTPRLFAAPRHPNHNRFWT